MYNEATNQFIFMKLEVQEITNYSNDNPKQQFDHATSNAMKN